MWAPHLSPWALPVPWPATPTSYTQECPALDSSVPPPELLAGCVTLDKALPLSPPLHLSHAVTLLSPCLRMLDTSPVLPGLWWQLTPMPRTHPLPLLPAHPNPPSSPTRPYLELGEELCMYGRVSCGHQRDRGFLCGARSEGGVGGGGGSSHRFAVLPPLRKLGTVCYPGAGMYRVFQMASVQFYPGCFLFMLLLQWCHPAVPHPLSSAYLPAEFPWLREPVFSPLSPQPME